MRGTHTNEKGPYQDYKVRVQEPGTAFYIEYPDVKVDVQEGCVILVDRQGIQVAIHPIDKIIYCVIPRRAKDFR